MSRPPKVFGIGFHKTGTTSLRAALEHLGYSVTGPNNQKEADIGETYVERTRALSKQYDAFQDNPWPLVYREMDAMWPGARFILTTRDPEAWIASQVKHFGTRETPMRRAIYGAERGCPSGNEAHYKRVFQDHNAAVRAYFADRPDDFLEIDLTQGPVWEELCRFLGHDMPEIPFPHVNQGTRRKAAPRARTPLRMLKKALNAIRS